MRNQDTSHVNKMNDCHVVSRIGLLATNIVQWQPRDESRIESDFVLGTSVKNVFVLTLVCKTNMLQHTVSISATNLDACVCVSVCLQNLTNFCPYALISTPNVP